MEHVYECDFHNVLHWNYREFVEFPVKSLLERGPVSEIYMKENKIVKLPRENLCLLYVKKLYLSGNNIDDFPVEMCKLPHLQHIDMSGNSLCAIPDEICQMENLQNLILDDNRLKCLPLSLQNMRNLRKLSVNDNVLRWFPQKIGSNYYSTRVSFWRNRTLRHVPFAVWLHVLKDYQVSNSEKLCCLDDVESNSIEDTMKNTIKVCDTDIILPEKFHRIENCTNVSAVSLLELCLRKFYEIYKRHHAMRIDENNNGCSDEMPLFISEMLHRGPTALCDNSGCKCPLFGRTILAVCIRKLLSGKEILVTSYFCSKGCCLKWNKDYNVQQLTWTKVR